MKTVPPSCEVFRRKMKTCKQCNVPKPETDFYVNRHQCKPCAIETQKKWNAGNTDSRRKYREDWHARNADRMYDIRKEYRQRPERKAAQRVHNLTRIAREKNAEGFHTPSCIRMLMHKQNGMCARCGCDIQRRYHIDHIIPLVRGGSNWPTNLQLLCPTCNMSKGSRMPSDW